MGKKFSYPATLRQDEDGRWVVFFSDLPEALTDGADEAEALAEACDALAEAVAGRIRREEEIPEPSLLEPGQRLVDLTPLLAAKAALYLALRRARLSKVALAARLGCDEKEVRRLLDPRHPSKLPRLSQAVEALGHRLVVSLVLKEEPGRPG